MIWLDLTDAWSQLCVSVRVPPVCQGWPTVYTCPLCGLTCQLWSTTISSLQTDPARRPEASAKRCGASTRKTARWVQQLTMRLKERWIIRVWLTSASEQQELHQHNNSLNLLPATSDTPSPLHLHAAEVRSQKSQQIAKSSLSHWYWPIDKSWLSCAVQVLFTVMFYKVR